MTHDLGGWLVEAMAISVFALIELFSLSVLGTRKLETLGYPTVKTASLCVPSF